MLSIAYILCCESITYCVMTVLHIMLYVCGSSDIQKCADSGNIQVYASVMLCYVEPC